MFTRGNQHSTWLHRTGERCKLRHGAVLFFLSPQCFAQGGSGTIIWIIKINEDTGMYEQLQDEFPQVKLAVCHHPSLTHFLPASVSRLHQVQSEFESRFERVDSFASRICDMYYHYFCPLETHLVREAQKSGAGRDVKICDCSSSRPQSAPISPVPPKITLRLAGSQVANGRTLEHHAERLRTEVCFCWQQMLTP